MRSKMNPLALAGFTLSIVSFVLTVFSALCIFRVMLFPIVGAITCILALITASVGLTMTGIARTEIVQFAQFGDEYAVSGMIVGIVACAFAIAAMVVYFVLFT